MKCSLVDIVRIDCHLMRVNVVKFHLAVTSFAACDITLVIHSELVLVDIMKCSLMDIVRIDCHLMRVNVVKFHLAVASFAACDITSAIHPV